MGIYVYIQLIHFVVQQKVTHHCKELYSNKDVKKKKRLPEARLKECRPFTHPNLISSPTLEPLL